MEDTLEALFLQFNYPQLFQYVQDLRRSCTDRSITPETEQARETLDELRHLACRAFSLAQIPR